MDNNETGSAHPHPHPSERRRGVVAGLVYVFEQVMPDPFVLSIGLTLVVILLAFSLSSHATLPEILASW